MGSLVKSPKAPPPVAVEPPSVVETVEPVNTEPSAAERSASQREKNLLARERSRFGTVATSLQRFLTQNNEAQGRKTLLGE